jgi:polar amino acid transport system substrate-binding protein
MQWQKLIKTGTILAFSSLLFVGCSASEEATDTDKKTLTLATSADYKPYEYHDTTNGKDQVIGFDIELAQIIGKELGYTIKISDMDFNGLIPALQSKRADLVMAGMTPTPDRKRAVDFSEIYFEEKNIIITTKKGYNIKTLKDFEGKSVGVQLGSIQEEAVKKIKGVMPVSLNKVPDIIQELKAGRLDAALVESTIGKGYVANNPDLQFSEFPNAEQNGVAIAFPKGSPHVAEFNRVLKQMKENGKLDELIKKWFQQ